MASLTLSFGLDNMTPETQDRLIAPKISQLTSPNFPEIADQRKYPLNVFIFNFELSLTIENKRRQFIFNIIRKSCDALDEYCSAIDSLKSFIDEPQISTSHYFSAVRNFEHCLAHIYQAVVCMNALAACWNGERQFEAGDGSILERVNLIYRDIKHMDERFENADGANSVGLKHSQSDFSNVTTIPLWLTNAGLESISAKVSYHELAQEIIEIHNEARELARVRRKSPSQTSQG
jgi:hypothetical protein